MMKLFETHVQSPLLSSTNTAHVLACWHSAQHDDTVALGLVAIVMLFTILYLLRQTSLLIGKVTRSTEMWAEEVREVLLEGAAARTRRS